jgi:hypothetical protein
MFGRARQLVEIGLGDAAHAQRFGIDLRLFGKDAVGELVGRHFEAEEGDRRPCRRRDAVALVLLCPEGGGEGDVGGKRRLSHRRAPGQHDEVGIVEAAEPAVEAGQPGGEAGQMPSRLHGACRHVDGARGGGREGQRRPRYLAGLGDAVERFLGRLDLLQRRDFLRGVGGAGDEVGADAHQRAQQRQLVDLGGAVAGTEQHGRILGEPEQVIDSAKGSERLVLVEQRPQRHRAGQHVEIGEPLHLGIDAAVERLVEMLLAQPHRHFLEDAVLDEKGAEQHLLGLDVEGKRRIAGGRAVDRKEGRHHRALMRPERRRGHRPPRRSCGQACG